MKRIFNGSGGRKTALILSLCLIFALAVGTTFALLQAHTDPVTNTFKAAESKITIEEKTDNGIKSEIYVKNEGTAVSYVRVKLVMNWVDNTTGNIVSGDNLPNVTLNSDNSWFLGSDGIYYYKMPVAANGGKTTNLLNTPIEQNGAPEGCHLEVTVLAESIQAAPSKAVTESWNVQVNTETGNLMQPTPTP